MEYKEFTCAVEKCVNMELKGGIKASLYTAVKNNGKEKKGVLIERPGVNISPTIYLEEFYERFQKGESMDCIIRDILNFYELVKCEESWDTSGFERFDEIRNKIVFKIIHTAKNEELLKSVPSMEFLDLSIVFYALLEVNKEGTATMPISNEHLYHWNVTKEELFSEACKNGKRLLPAQLFTMRQAMTEILEPYSEKQENLLEHRGDPQSDVMYVLSNSLRSLGAACIAYPNVLAVAGEVLGEDYYVLPSSIHEVILVPGSKAMDQNVMDEMVVEINETQVAEEEVLSNHAYYYDKTKRRLVMQQYAKC